ncbi:MAG: nicotinate phosphoribosyltransferase, partial [Lachnospiraceae bacterium]|nr:nicotinate phosphoribosyltransferase [Lachnospiraceae bacterium]
MGNEHRDLSLLTDLYELTMMQGYFREGKESIAIFDAFYRKNPCDGGYAITAGLEQVIDYIKNLRFTAEDVAYLRSL